MSEMVTRRLKATRMRAKRRKETTRDSAKAVTLGNLADTMPDTVASMTSKEGMLGSQGKTDVPRWGGWGDE